MRNDLVSSTTHAESEFFVEDETKILRVSKRMKTRDAKVHETTVSGHSRREDIAGPERLGMQCHKFAPSSAAPFGAWFDPLFLEDSFAPRGEGTPRHCFPCNIVRRFPHVA